MRIEHMYLILSFTMLLVMTCKIFDNFDKNVGLKIVNTKLWSLTSQSSFKSSTGWFFTTNLLRVVSIEFYIIHQHTHRLNNLYNVKEKEEPVNFVLFFTVLHELHGLFNKYLEFKKRKRSANVTALDIDCMDLTLNLNRVFYHNVTC